MVEYTQFRQQTAAVGASPGRTPHPEGGKKHHVDLIYTGIGVYQCFFRRRCGARPAAAVIES